MINEESQIPPALTENASVRKESGSWLQKNTSLPHSPSLARLAAWSDASAELRAAAGLVLAGPGHLRSPSPSWQHQVVAAGSGVDGLAVGLVRSASRHR